MKKYYVLGFLFSEDKSKVVLIRKQTPAWQQGFLNGVGGKIELIDENIPMLAMIREFKEEAGVEVKSWIEFCRLSATQFEVYCFKAVGDVTQVKTMEEEQIEVHEVCSIINSEQDVMNNLPWLLLLALDSDKIYGEINYF